MLKLWTDVFVRVQTQIVAAAAAGVAAEGLSPRTAKAEAEAVASLSMSLAENALVLLMLVEDHLRLETQAYNMTLLTKAGGPALTNSSTLLRRSVDGPESLGSRRSNTSGFDVIGPSLENSPSRRPQSNSETGSLTLEALLCSKFLSMSFTHTTTGEFGLLRFMHCHVETIIQWKFYEFCQCK